LFFDTLKLIPRNMFCLRLREFRRHYDNLRDDHVILRAFTHAAGTQAGEETLLHPGVLTSQRKLEGIFRNVLEALSEVENKKWSWIALSQCCVEWEEGIIRKVHKNRV
jgi:hypothetical protein